MGMTLEQALFCSRTGCFLFSAATFVVILGTERADYFRVFFWLRVESFVQMMWSGVRLPFQVACLWFGRPQPSNRTLSLLIIVEGILMLPTLGLAWAAVGVVTFLHVDIHRCHLLPAGTCVKFWFTAITYLFAGFLSAANVFGTFWVLGSRFHVD